YREPETVQLDDRRDQAQTKARSEGGSALLRTIEAPGDGFPFIFPDAWSGVRNSDDAFILALDQGEFHVSTFGREFQSVVDQVRDCLNKQVPVAAYYCVVSTQNAQGDALVLRDGFIHVSDFIDEVC